jgi:hypothetical protein
MSNDVYENYLATQLGTFTPEQRMEIANFIKERTGNTSSVIFSENQTGCFQNSFGINPMVVENPNVIVIPASINQSDVKKQMGIDRAKSRFVQQLIPMLEKMYNESGHTEFWLAMQSPHSFIVHPQDKDGETIEINWKPAI